MKQCPRPRYTDKNSLQTLREGLAEYYEINAEYLTNPNTQPADFAEILLAHDVGHIIYGCDTSMYDELRILPLFWWTSECTFKVFRQMNKNPAVDIMYQDLIKRYGVMGLYGSILLAVPRLLPEVISLWFKTRKRKKLVPFLEFKPLLDRPLVEIRQEFDLWAFF